MELTLHQGSSSWCYLNRQKRSEGVVCTRLLIFTMNCYEEMRTFLEYSVALALECSSECCSCLMDIWCNGEGRCWWIVAKIINECVLSRFCTFIHRGPTEASPTDSNLSPSTRWEKKLEGIPDTLHLMIMSVHKWTTFLWSRVITRSTEDMDKWSEDFLTKIYLSLGK